MNRLLLPLIAVCLVFCAATAASANDNANLWVIHGIPGKDLKLDPRLPVDIKVNGKGTLAGFTFGKIAGPLSVPPGSYKIEIAPANKTKPYSEKPIIVATIKLGLKENAVAIAHLDAKGGATASKFTQDFSRTKWLNTRVIAHHTANAPAVDVKLKRLGWWRGKELAFENVTNGGQAAVEIFTGFWAVGVFPAGKPMPVLQVKGPAIPRFTYSIFVVGSLENETLAFILLPYRTR